MISNKYISLLISLLCGLSLYAQKVNIRVFSSKEISSFVVTIIDGDYALIADTTIFKFDINNVFQITANGEYLSLKSLDGIHGNFKRIKITGKAEKNIFKIKPSIPDLKPRTYDDNLIITLLNKQLLIVNEVDLESYVAGVVESEGGIKAQPEFFKTQALLCRTWALFNFDKHLAEGYQLCDDTHCQVYHNKCLKSKEIVSATKETEGLVIVDTAINLISATFHSNCGGQTVNSEDIWGRPRSYLQSVTDPFCSGERQAFWEKKMTLDNFRQYLRSNGFKLSNDAFANDSVIFSQTSRKAYLKINNDSLHLKKMRSDLKLKSTFFSIYKNGKELTFKGRGYGHGVGLCQEGAMLMARRGYNFTDIVKYYYKNINIVSLKALNFFNASVQTPITKDSLEISPIEKPVD